MKSIGFIEKLKGLSSKELILLGIILSIFLPFYLFVVVLCLYIISLIFTGDMKSILQKMGEHPMLLLFLSYSTVISILAQNWMGLVASVGMFLFTIFFLHYQSILSHKFFRLILQFVLFGSVLSAAFASLEHFQIVKKFNYAFLSPNMQVWHQNRAEVTFFNPNYYGIICCFCIMIAFYLFTTTKLNWLKVFCVIAGFVNLFGLNFTQNRTAFPAIIAGAIIYLFTTIKNWKAFWLSIGVFAIGLSFLFSSDLGVRMGTLDSSMEERISIWDAGMALFKQNPFWGEGPLTYMHSYPRIHAPYHEHAHSLYIDTILSYGIVGTILLVLSSAAPVRLMMDMSQESGKRPIIGLYLSFLTVVAVHGIFDLALFWIQSGFIFLLVMCSIPLEHRMLVSDMTD
ncbi:O-Antigen Polymerase family [Streptococcus pneumoniae]|uniref:O-antigen ligase family protein n=1 Tax=Streptococcus pneumoniae TaxID=1313 RepID=UPI00016C26D7|nr:O-antigen ligase [Streptococcus pneumoniae]EGJ14527.1 O-Antigen Polymerase family protein [Streptococcus pneumoniae GA47368]EHD43751.1 O-Antigen Polymerase family protein [Streptococcus pneumoniae GA44452]EHD59083.1 O-Antigen Polymerase family protein [Streptococcus pneumoniae GA41410]EHD61925.1 O-Antigen Polymerase family protein [Streptococcus pneumoniae GA49447]EHE07149.1 O-Antigen Polymerase family protein [Streptococcus pneumoniae GA17328]EHE14078.1 O-Antigen Polymerase family protein